MKEEGREYGKLIQEGGREEKSSKIIYLIN